MAVTATDRIEKKVLLTVRGTVVPTTVDAGVASAQQAYAGMRFDIMVERIEPERLFSFRWHPGAQPEDSSQETTTLVVFTLDDAPGGIMLTVTGSGFDQVPLSRRAKAFAENEQGWTMQMKLIEKYRAQNA